MTPEQAAEQQQQQMAPRVSAREARNLVELLLLNARKASASSARQKVAGAWRDYSWGEVIERVRRLSEGLVALGVQPGDRVAIYAATRLEWALADLAIMGARAISVPVYASNTAAEVEYIVNDSGATVVVFDNDNPDGKPGGRWARLQEIRARMPKVQHYVAIDMPSRPDQQLLSLTEIESKGEATLRQNPKALEARAAQIQRDDLSCILYTSGTTGAPKGVMLTHGNWGYEAWAINQTDILNPDDLALLFLPLAHSFAKVVEAAWVGLGFPLAFAEAVERAVDNCAEVRATVMPAVPRVFEKAYAKVVADGSAQPGVKGRLFRWAMGLFEEYSAARIAGREYASVQWAVAKRVVFSKVEEKLKNRFGGRMRLFISGGAPLSRKVAYFFELCGLVILEGYGLTETSAPIFANRPGKIRIGTVGQAFPETEARLAEDGELLVRGPQVMKGYFNMPAETAEVLEPDGWFHTGDIGEIDAEGFLRITDRKKDLIKTSGGKYIAPQELENALKTEPLISQAVIIGDRRRYVSALITLSEENLVKWAKDNGMTEATYENLVHRPEVRARVQAAVDALNASLPSYATIKRFAILDTDWSQNTGELTPKLSVRRKVVTEKYKSTVDALYDHESYD